MVEADKKRFLDVLRWLCSKYPVDGRPRALPVGEDLADYFAALRDLGIEALEGGSRWHYGHSEFYPDRPAALRKSCEAWRAENPQTPLRAVFTPAAREQVLAERCDPGRFESFMLALDEMTREKFGVSVRDDQGRVKPVADDRRSRLQEQKQQLAILAGSDS